MGARTEGINSHKRGSGYKPERITISAPTYVALKELSETHCLTHDLAIDLLIEFYTMRRLDLVIRQIRIMYDRGLTVLEVNQLSVLYTLLQAIDDRIGLA